MPWRAPYVRYRRHPLALAVYATVCALGALLACTVLNSTSLDAVMSPLLRWSWEWEMIVGGAAGMLACFMPTRFIEGTLRMEGAGAALCACGLWTYAVSIIYVVGASSAGWVLFAVLGLGCVWRAVETIGDGARMRRTAEKLALLERARRVAEQ